MNTIFDLLHVSTTTSGSLNGGILILAIVGAFLGLMTISESDDLSGL